MEELVKTFHIDIKLIAQLINFSVVLFVLYKFAYGPILKTLNERAKKIEKGLKNSEEAEKKFREMVDQEKDILKKAREEAQVILTKAEDQAQKSKDEIIEEGRSQSGKLMREAEKKIADEKEKMISEIKSEIGGLVVLATEKLISEKLDVAKDKDLIEKSIR